MLCSRHLTQVSKKLAVSTSPETAPTLEKPSSSNFRCLYGKRYRKGDFSFSWRMAFFFSQRGEFSLYFKL